MTQWDNKSNSTLSLHYLSFKVFFYFRIPIYLYAHICIIIFVKFSHNSSEGGIICQHYIYIYLFLFFSRATLIFPFSSCLFIFWSILFLVSHTLCTNAILYMIRKILLFLIRSFTFRLLLFLFKFPQVYMMGQKHGNQEVGNWIWCQIGPKSIHHGFNRWRG